MDGLGGAWPENDKGDDREPSRSAFEAYVISTYIYGPPPSNLFDQKEGGDYFEYNINKEWKAWQAAIIWYIAKLACQNQQAKKEA